MVDCLGSSADGSYIKGKRADGEAAKGVGRAEGSGRVLLYFEAGGRPRLDEATDPQ